MRCWQLAVYLLSYLWPTLNHSFGFRSSYELRRTGFSHAHEGLIQDTGKLFFSTRLHHWHTDLETAWAIQILPCIEREKKEKEGEKPQQTDFIWQWWKSAPSQVLSNDVYTVGFNCEKLLCEAAVTLANESGRGSCTGNRDPPSPFPLLSFPPPLLIEFTMSLTLHPFSSSLAIPFSRVVVGHNK